MTDTPDDTIEALLRRQFAGAVPDDGFSEHVMQRLPRHRRGAAWPLWIGVLAGAAVCWLSLLSTPLLRVGWQAWMRGDLSAPAITVLVAMAGMSLLAVWWSTMEADDY